jgi:hypothetical protein
MLNICFPENRGRAGQAIDDKQSSTSLALACWMTNAKNTDSECVILVSFPRQQWQCERVSMLRYTYTDCLVSACVWRWKETSLCVILLWESFVTLRMHFIVFWFHFEMMGLEIIRIIIFGRFVSCQ